MTGDRTKTGPTRTRAAARSARAAERRPSFMRTPQQRMSLFRRFFGIRR